MKLIVGLGNPGEAYAPSRHNIGFTVVKALAKKYKAVLKKDFAISSLSARIKIAGQSVVLSLPLTFMNLSGLAVKPLVKKYKIDLNDLLIVCDDLDLEFGRLKMRACGSSAGHRGMQSIIDSLKKEDFARLRIGIGRPSHKDLETADYVLSAFSKKEKVQVSEIIERALGCCQSWVTKGVTETMNAFNKRSDR